MTDSRLKTLALRIPLIAFALVSLALAKPRADQLGRHPNTATIALVALGVCCAVGLLIWAVRTADPNLPLRRGALRSALLPLVFVLLISLTIDAPAIFKLVTPKSAATSTPQKSTPIDAVAAFSALIAALTLFVNFKSLQLQRRQTSDDPGHHVDPGQAAKALDQINEDPVRTIAAKYIFVNSEKKPVGYIQRQPISIYLDLHTASCDPQERAVLAASLADFIRRTLGQRIENVSIAAPREGNLIVAASVAAELKANFLMIRTGRAPRFGYPIEGSVTTGQRVVLVDDLCMEGSFLKRCVELLRKGSLSVSECFCLFERNDGDAREALSAVNVELHSKYRIDDQELKRLSR